MTDIVRRRRWVRVCVFVGNTESREALKPTTQIQLTSETNLTTSLPDTSLDEQQKVSLNSLLNDKACPSAQTDKPNSDKP